MSYGEEIDLNLIAGFLQEAAPRGRTMLLPSLHHAQTHYGWLPREVQQAIGEALRVPLAEIHGVIEFYTMFYNQPTSRRVIRVCEDSACHLAGAPAVMAAIEGQTGLSHGQTAADRSVTYEKVPCLGMCDHAPCALDGDKPAAELTPATVPDLLEGRLPEPDFKIYGQPLVKMYRVHHIDPLSLNDYLDHQGYAGLKAALSLQPLEVIEMLESSDILGRGGAMFPVGRKWRFTRLAPGEPAEKHIIANADESEPGTFKDRGLMEQDPYNLIEAMTLAAYAVGAENGWIFVRGEYPRSYQRLVAAVEKAREGGYLGRDILGKPGFHFDIEMRLGAGAYICGEETALFEAIEGKRGFPRIKPPYPTTHGLFGQPTALNNVETLVAALAAVRMGIAEWQRLGTASSSGTKWFCLSGHVTQPGLYEVPFGLTINELVRMAGGVTGSGEVQAILIGGAAGAFIGPELMDVPLTYEDARQHGFPLGSGVIMVLDTTVDLMEINYQLARFFKHESCGKCFPCQLGTQRQLEILQRIVRDGSPQPGDRQALEDIGQAMTLTSICGLGQTAAVAILSSLERWPELMP